MYSAILFCSGRRDLNRGGAKPTRETRDELPYPFHTIYRKEGVLDFGMSKTLTFNDFYGIKVEAFCSFTTHQYQS